MLAYKDEHKDQIKGLTSKTYYRKLNGMDCQKELTGSHMHMSKEPSREDYGPMFIIVSWAVTSR